MQLRSLILSVSLLMGTWAYSQQIPKDTIFSTIEASELDSVYAEENIPNDSLLSTDETLYKNNWNSTQIKYPLNTLPPKDATITITLAQTNDHPFVNPVIGKVISKYGKRGRRMHTGTDIKINSGDTIRCAFDGRVRLAKRFSGYGNMVLVRHHNGLETIYAHLKTIKVTINDTIKAGDVIGLGGRTGRATCDHLHFETRLFGEPFDACKYIDFRNYCLRSNHIYYRNKQFEIDLANFDKKHVVAPKPALTANVHAECKDSTALTANSPVKVGTGTTSSKSVATKVTSTKATKHVVRNGENLWVIAKKYHTTVNKLCQANNISAQKPLKVGAVLKIN